MLIEIEGIDGVGKTTQCSLLKEWLHCKQRKVIVVKDLGSTNLGKSIRDVITKNDMKSPRTELFSFLACKSQLFSEIIIPFLNNGGIVICDRGTGSFVSYFEALGFDRDFLLQMVNLSTNNLNPHLTILLDTPTKEATGRIGLRADKSKFDEMGERFFSRQREIFLDLSSGSSWVKIEGINSVEKTHSLITTYVGDML